MKLVIGDKNFSSWSLRPWMVLKHSGLPFREVKVGLDRPNTDRQIRRHSPSGLVPVLIDGKTTIWDSLAISEYIAERVPTLLPEDRARRGVMRSYVAEMHSSFSSLRAQMSMDVQMKVKLGHLTSGTISDIQRILELWEKALKVSGGPYLFGSFTIADAFFAPVVTRFVSYGVEIKSVRCRKYMKTMLADPHLSAWIRDAKKEKPYRVKF